MGPDGPVKHDRYARAADSWGFNHDGFLLGLPAAAPAPDPSDYAMTFPAAADAENALNKVTSDLSDENFALRNTIIGDTAHTGLFLPAPSTATWTGDLPPGAVLDFAGMILSPEIVTPQMSDGAKILVEVRKSGDEAWTEVGETDVEVGVWVTARHPVGLQGPAELRIRTTGRGNDVLDYVFLEEPTVHVPSADPKRVVLVFVDTLRPDHLGMYGYERDTTPKLDVRLGGGAVFTQTRNVAPWTLPSARAALSGSQPEMWAATDNLPHRLAEAGFATRGFVTNAYLSTPFEMHRGWSAYSYRHLRPAKKVVDDALEWLDGRPDRDAMVMVHFMEAHLPYREPPAYQGLFAGDKPDALAQVARNDLVRIDSSDRYAAIHEYVQARYDQNIRVVDDEVSRLIDAVGANATVVLFSDHGEEFWDHNGFEHGHSFYDELLHVPLVIRDPHLQGGEHGFPSSLLDITSTVLELSGLESDTPDGRSLVGASFGDEDEISAFNARPQGFGRPLYGADGWGVVTEGVKWFSRGGEDHAFDLGSDPTERHDIGLQIDSAQRATELAQALGTPVDRVFRIKVESRPGQFPVLWTFESSRSVQASQNAYDPRGFHEEVRPVVTEGKAVLAQPERADAPKVIYLRVKGDAAEADLTATVSENGATATVSFAPGSVIDKAGRLQGKGRSITVDLAWIPRPVGNEVAAFHPSVAEQLKELGYLDE